MDNTYSEFGRRLVSLKGLEETNRAFAIRLGIHYTTLSRVLYSKNAPGKSVLEKISRATGKSIDWLLGASDDHGGKQTSGAKDVPCRYIPLIPYDQIADFSKESDSVSKSLGMNAHRVITEKTGENLFATKLVSKAMEPFFEEGDVLLIDMDADCKTGDIIIARLEGRTVIGKLAVLDGHKFIQPANDKFKHVSLSTRKGAIVVGRVVERRTRFK